MLRCVLRREQRAESGDDALVLVAGKVVGFGGRILDIDASSFDAAFGLDVIEDAACHAARAALTVQHALAHRDGGCATATAVHTAEMLVGHVADRVEIAADARHAAAAVLDRLIQANDTSAVTVSEGSRPFLEHRFRLSLVPTTTDPSLEAVWALTAVADALRMTPLVSRIRELSLLEGLLAHAEDGLGHALLLTGDAGIGKSRLLQELQRRTGSRFIWLTGTAVSYGAALPFHPLIDLLRRSLAVQASDADETIGARLDQAVEQLRIPRSRLPFLRALMSIDPGDPSFAQMDPKLRRAGIVEAIRDYLRATADTRPMAIVLEDAHWFDQATAELMPVLIDELSNSPALLCVTSRTGYPLPISEHAFATRVTLQRLTPQESLDLAREILDTADLPSPLQLLIADKTDGNPFFVEEMMRSLQERGLVSRSGEPLTSAATGRLEVPDRVEDVISGRLDRLDPTAREILQVAAVIGREFSRPVLTRVLERPPETIDGALHALVAAELLSMPKRSASSLYAFKHALTQDVAYRALDEQDRQALHGRIADAIEAEYAGRVAEHVGVLAQHFVRARRWAKALEHLIASAQSAERAFATREALALYDEALAAAGHLAGGAGDPATLMKIHEAKARLYFVTSDFERSAAEGERILPLARLTANPIKEAEALATIAWASTWGRNLDAAVRAARQSLAVAEPAGALAVQGRALFTIGWVGAVTGVLDESEQAIDRALTISRAAGDAVHQSLSLTTAGLLRNWTGDFDAAARLQDDGLALARERGLLVPLLFNCFLRGLTLVGRGDYDLAFESLQEGLSLAERVGDEAIHHRLLNCLAWLYSDLGDLDEAERLNAASARIGRRRHDPGTQPNAELNLGDILHARGDLDAAQDLFDGVFRYWKNPSTSEWMRFRYSIRMFASMGELALERGDHAAARTHAAECLELATRTGARKNLIKGLRLSAALASAGGEHDRAEAHLRRALAIAESLRNPVQHWKTLLALHDLVLRQQRVDQARDACQTAVSVMNRVAGALKADRLQQAFAGNTDVRRASELLATYR
jgi:tetratricopeptide (TPR) repeat protein